MAPTVEKRMRGAAEPLAFRFARQEGQGLEPDVWQEDRATPMVVVLEATAGPAAERSEAEDGELRLLTSTVQDHLSRLRLLDLAAPLPAEDAVRYVQLAEMPDAERAPDETKALQEFQDRIRLGLFGEYLFNTDELIQVSEYFNPDVYRRFKPLIYEFILSIYF